MSMAMIIWQALIGAGNVLIAQKFTSILLVIVPSEDCQSSASVMIYDIIA